MKCMETLLFADKRHLPAVKVTEGDGDGVGGVVWLGDLGKTKETLHHQLYLGFISSAIACQGLLDLKRSVFIDEETGIGQSEEDGAATLGDRDHGFFVFEKEELFDGGLMWLMGSDDFTQVGRNLHEAPRERSIGRRTDVSIGDRPHLATELLDDRPPHRRRSGVDTKDTHS